jgi:hypothetical protein
MGSGPTITNTVPAQKAFISTFAMGGLPQAEDVAMPTPFTKPTETVVPELDLQLESLNEASAISVTGGKGEGGSTKRPVLSRKNRAGSLSLAGLTGIGGKETLLG